MKVIFEPLPKEDFFTRLWRSITSNFRANEHITVSLNGKTLIIKRGVVVDVPEWVPELTFRASEHWNYNCYIPYKPKAILETKLKERK